MVNGSWSFRFTLTLKEKLDITVPQLATCYENMKDQNRSSESYLGEHVCRQTKNLSDSFPLGHDFEELGNDIYVIVGLKPVVEKFEALELGEGRIQPISRDGLGIDDALLCVIL